MPLTSRTKPSGYPIGYFEDIDLKSPDHCHYYWFTPWHYMQWRQLCHQKTMKEAKQEFSWLRDQHQLISYIDGEEIFSSSVWKQFSFFNIWLTSKIGASTSPAAAIYTNDEVVTQEYATDEVVTQEYTSDEVVTQEYGHKGDGIREDSESSLDKCQLSISRSQVSVLGRVEGQETVMHQTCPIFISPSGAHTCLTSLQNTIMRYLFCLGQLFRLWWKQKTACFRLHDFTGKSYMHGIQLASLT